MDTGLSTCRECGENFHFGEGCFEFDDGDMCALCYTLYCEGEANYSKLEDEKEANIDKAMSEDYPCGCPHPD